MRQPAIDRMRNGVPISPFALIYLISLSSLVSLSYAAKIAVVSYNLGTSHIMFAGAIADTLVDAGHTVHFFQVQQDDAIRTNGSRKAQKLFYIPSIAPNTWNDMAFRMNPFKPFNVETPSFFVNATLSFKQSCHDVLASRELLDSLRSEKYDIGISEAYGFHGFGLLYMLGVREYVLSTNIPFQPAFASMFNIPTPASYVTSCLDAPGSLETPNLSYFRRIYNTALHAMNYWIFQRFSEKHTEIFRAYYPEMPPLEELVRKSALILVNTPPLLELPRPTTHKVLHIGGLADIVPDKPISPDIMRIVDDSRPFVIISFGTLARTVFIEGELLDNFLSAFGRFPEVTFIWKFDEAAEHNTTFAKYPNVHPVRWLPQKQLLRLPNARGFVTHVGMNSLLESAQSGIPMVAIPLFTDQQYNSKIAVNRGIAVFVDKTQITADSLGDALQKILYDRQYSHNSKKIRDQLAGFPRPPAQELVNFIDYIAKFGAPRGGMFELPSQSFIYTQALDIYIPAAVAATAAAAAFCLFLVYIFGLDLGFLQVSIKVYLLDDLVEHLMMDEESEDEWDEYDKRD